MYNFTNNNLKNVSYAIQHEEEQLHHITNSKYLTDKEKAMEIDRHVSIYNGESKKHLSVEDREAYRNAKLEQRGPKFKLNSPALVYSDESMNNYQTSLITQMWKQEQISAEESDTMIQKRMIEIAAQRRKQDIIKIIPPAIIQIKDNNTQQQGPRYKNF